MGSENNLGRKNRNVENRLLKMLKPQKLVFCYCLLYSSCSTVLCLELLTRRWLMVGMAILWWPRAPHHRAIFGHTTILLKGVQNSSLLSGILVQKVGLPSHAQVLKIHGFYFLCHAVCIAEVLGHI